MDIMLGKFRVNLSSAGLYTRTNATSKIERMLRQATKRNTLYLWDCQTQTGRGRRGPKAQAKPFYVIAGKTLPIGEFEMDDFWFKLAGLTKAQFLTAIQDNFPIMSLDLNWNELWERHKNDYSLRIAAQARYTVVYGRPYGLTLGDHMYLAIPHEITVMSIVTGRCNNGTEPNGRIIDGMTIPRYLGEAPEDAKFRELDEQVRAEQEEIKDQRKVMDDYFEDADMLRPLFDPWDDPQDDGD